MDFDSPNGCLYPIRNGEMMGAGRCFVYKGEGVSCFSTGKFCGSREEQAGLLYDDDDDDGGGGGGRLRII